MISLDIGRKICELRKRRGWKAAEFGKLIGLSQGQISRLETGKQGLRSKTLLRIAEALDVSPVYFFMEDEEEGRPESSPVYGLLAGNHLLQALRSPEFVQVAEKLANVFLHRGDAFPAIRTVFEMVLDEAVKGIEKTPTRKGRRKSPAARKRKRTSKARAS
jgi:transcriptional regulator with XRE-family HTH domain